MDAYGKEAVAVLAGDPGRVVADSLLESEPAFLASADLRKLCDPHLRDAHLELHELFRGMGFWGACTKACLRTWKHRAPAVIRRDPFALLAREMPGCGFARVDQLYLKLGLPPRRLRRQCFAAWHAVRSLDGDTWAGLNDAMSAIRRQIGGTEPREKRAVAMACRAGMLCLRMDARGRYFIAERGKAASERTVAVASRKALAEVGADWPAVGEEEGLSEHQSAELAKALTGRVGLLTGSPGTGKTYAAALLIKACVRRWGADKVKVCAPTGKAARRLSDVIGRVQFLLRAGTRTASRGGVRR